MNDIAYLNEVLTVITITFLILQIILFFKIWEMTNNVKEIEQRNSTSAKIREAKIYCLKGNKEKAKDVLDTAFFNEFLDGEKESYLKDQAIEKYKTIYSILNLEMPNVEGLINNKD